VAIMISHRSSSFKTGDIGLCTKGVWRDRILAETWSDVEVAFNDTIIFTCIQ
jgi:hypothetical protein